MSPKRKKSVVPKKNKGLFAIHKHLIWLLPVFLTSVALLLWTSNKLQTEEFVKGVSTTMPAKLSPICKSGVKSFQVYDECEKERFRYVKYSCFDGSAKEDGGATSCKSFKEWEDHAKKFCEDKFSCKETPGISKKPTKTPVPSRECRRGLNSFSLIEECEKDRFRYVEYACHDGTKGKLGSNSSCKTSSNWQVYAKKVCEEKTSCKTPTPSRKLTPKPTSQLTPRPTREPTPTI